MRTFADMVNHLQYVRMVSCSILDLGITLQVIKQPRNMKLDKLWHSV